MMRFCQQYIPLCEQGHKVHHRSKANNAAIVSINQFTSTYARPNPNILRSLPRWRSKLHIPRCRYTITARIYQLQHCHSMVCSNPLTSSNIRTSLSPIHNLSNTLLCRKLCSILPSSHIALHTLLHNLHLPRVMLLQWACSQ